MVQIITNPAYSNVDTSGERIGQALSGIASAFAPRAADIQGQLALFNAKQKLGAEGTIGDAIAKSADAQQDYAQDAPDYEETQPGPTIDVNDPAGLGRAFMAMGQSPGKALQAVSALQGGPTAPGVVLGAIPDNTVKETPQYIDQAANAPKDLSAGSRLVNPMTGATVAENPAADKNENVVVQLPDGTHQVINKSTGELVGAPIGTPKSATVLKDVHGNPVDENLTGPDVLKVVPPPVATMAQRMIDGLQPVPAQSVRMSPLAQQAVIAAQAADPTIDANESKIRMGVQKDFTSGPTSKVITAGNTALGHLTELTKLIPQLGNTDLAYGATPLNAIANAAKGSGSSGTPLARFNELNQLYSAEMEKFYAGSSGGTAGERKQLELNIGANMSPSQQRGAIQTAATALASKVEALQGQWHSGMGPLAKDFDVIHEENKPFVAAMRAGPLGTLLPGQPSGAAQGPPTGQSQPSFSVPPAAAEYLKANPALAGQFDQKYGAGSSRSILGGSGAQGGP